MLHRSHRIASNFYDRYISSWQHTLLIRSTKPPQKVNDVLLVHSGLVKFLHQTNHLVFGLSGADHFVKSFYPALQSNRKTLSSYYADSIGTILLNGNQIANGAAVQQIFEKDMPPTHYEISSYDCQMLNPNYNPASATLAGSGAAESKGSGPLNISMLLTVSGSVRYGESRDLPNRVFSETFVLVPNEQMQQGRKDPRQKKYLIQCQNFRLVV